VEDKACKATGHRQAIECHLSGAPAAGVTVHLAAPPDDRSLSLGDTPEEVEKAFVVVNKLRRKWHSFARMTAPPSPPETALGAAEAKAEALLEEEAEWEASEEEEEKEGKLSDEAGLVGGLRRALQVRHSRVAFRPPCMTCPAHAAALSRHAGRWRWCDTAQHRRLPQTQRPPQQRRPPLRPRHQGALQMRCFASCTRTSAAQRWWQTAPPACSSLRRDARSRGWLRLHLSPSESAARR